MSGYNQVECVVTMAHNNPENPQMLDEFSSLAYLADASISCSGLQRDGIDKQTTVEEGPIPKDQSCPEENPTKSHDTETCEDLQCIKPNVEIDKKVKEQDEIASTVVAEDVSNDNSSMLKNVGHGCKECLTHSLKDLAQHILSKHKSVEGFKCDFCQTLYTTSISFGKHILSHVIEIGGMDQEGDPTGESQERGGSNPEKEGDGTYHCSTCDKRFSSFLDMQRHLSLHKNYVCAVCDKGFSRPVVFKKHMQVHSKEEIRVCEAERDQLYEEIKAAAAISKDASHLLCLSHETTPAAGTFVTSDDEELMDAKKRKRKNTPQKHESGSRGTVLSVDDIGDEETQEKTKRKRSSRTTIETAVSSRKKRGKGKKVDEPEKDIQAQGESTTDQGDGGPQIAEDGKKSAVLTGVEESVENMQDEKRPGGQQVDSTVSEQVEAINEQKYFAFNEQSDRERETVQILMDVAEASGIGKNDSFVVIAEVDGGEQLIGMKTEDDKGSNEKDEKEAVVKEKAKRVTSKRSTSYKCSHCVSEFKSRQEARDHERQMHNVVLPWQCEVCGEGFWSSSQFKKHSYIEHNDNVPFKCEHCGKKLSGPGILRTHLGIHTGIRPYACHICSRDFLTRTNLQDHLIKHANPRGYCCELCPSKFNLRTDLSSHIRTVHENIRPWKCEHCDYAFPRQSALLRHMRTHTGEKPHKCEFCGKTFARVENCMEHRRIHTGERPHVCEVCGKTFKDSGNFSNHRKIHKEGYVPRRKKKTGGKSEDGDKISAGESTGKAGRSKINKNEVNDPGKSFGLVGADGKVVGAAFDSLGSAVAALGSDGRVVGAAFESLGSAVAALIGSGIPPATSQGGSATDNGGTTVTAAEVDAAINGALVANTEAAGSAVTVGADNIALTTYPGAVMQGSTVPAATLHDIVNAATMSAAMVSNVPGQSETEAQEAMTHSNTFLQIGNVLFSLDIDNGLKSLNQVGNMGEFLTLSLAGAHVDADGQTVITQPQGAEVVQSQDVQTVQLGVLEDNSKTTDPQQIQIQALVGNAIEQQTPHDVAPNAEDMPASQGPPVMTCVVENPPPDIKVEQQDPTTGGKGVEVETPVVVPGHELEHVNDVGNDAANASSEMQTILPRPST